MHRLLNHSGTEMPQVTSKLISTPQDHIVSSFLIHLEAFAWYLCVHGINYYVPRAHLRLTYGYPERRC